MPRHDSSHAVVICTRNRPDELRRLLNNVLDLAPDIQPVFCVVDASDAHQFAQNKDLISTFRNAYRGEITHHKFDGKPSAARQRNVGIELCPGAIIIHFMDDDVTLDPGYFEVIDETFTSHPDVGGVGALIEDKALTTSKHGYLHRLFLLDSKSPGRVLPSGHVSIGQVLPVLSGENAPFEVEWLSTCGCAFRRAVLESYRFDEYLDRQTMEDRDLSFRVQNEWKLLVQPKARLTHHSSPINRANAERATYERVVNRLRFVRRTMAHPTNYLAFVWSEVGQLLALLLSNQPERKKALRGKIRAYRDVLRLQSPTQT